MQRTCGQCRSPFETTQQDSTFYEEMGVPPPTWCPECRSQLRCLHRNERSLFRRSCDLCRKDTVAMYPTDAPFPVICTPCFFGDGWDPLTYGKPYNLHRPFFEQYGDLLRRVPHLGIINKQCENSEYCNYAYANKNCYLTWGSHSEQDCLYEAYSTKMKDSMDFLHVYGSELVYECLFSQNCHRSIYLDRCEDCSECYFSRDLKGCSSCLFCANLRQKKYHIFNETHTRKEFEDKLASLKLHTWSGLQSALEAFLQELPKRFPVRAIEQVNCQNCEGGTLQNCKNMRRCFFSSDCEDCAYGCQMDQGYNSLDMDYLGYDKSERCYQTIGCQGLTRCLCCNACWHGGDLAYCQFCFNSSDCLGCSSLHRKKYCILNVQYGREEYGTIAHQIVDAMRSEGAFGSFFPAHLSPFAYNESMAQDWFPLSEGEARERGYAWRTQFPMPDVEKVIPADRLPDSISDIPDDVLNWAIRCEVSKRAFRIVRKELEFYRRMRLPVPRFHPEDRHRRRIVRRHGRKLFSRICGKCRKAIQTTYAPDRPERVYCERCYLQTVY